MSIKIVSSGHYLPEDVLTNDDLSQVVDTSDEWIQTRTGIRSRHIALNENTSDLAYHAAQNAMANGTVDPATIDFIIVATFTPDYVFPSVAAQLQKSLNLGPIFALDVNAACSGFVYGLEVATGLLATERYQRGLIVGAEVITKVIDFTDRNTCVLFGDGAGAFVVEAGAGQLKAVDIQSTGNIDVLGLAGYPLKENLNTPNPTLPFMYMQGKEVFKFAVDVVPKIIQSLLDQAQMSPDQVDAYVLHQANQRILDRVAIRFGIAKNRLISTLETTGNTSSASIPIAFDHALEEGVIKRGDHVIMIGFGGGLTWGGMLIEY